MMFSKSGGLVLVNLHGFAVWKIPRHIFTSAHGHKAQYPISNRPISPKYSLAVNFHELMQPNTGQKSSYTPPVFEKPSVWYEDFGSQPIVFDITRNRTGKHPSQFRWRYQLNLPALDDTNNPPTIECITRFTVPNDWTTMRMAGYCNDQLLLVGMCHDGFAGIVSAPGVSRRLRPNIDTKPHSGLIFQKRRQMLSDEFVFCPVTGRVCYETTPYMMTVLDYFHL